jgi:hypothetical protein
VYVRSSPSSPTQITAALLRRRLWTCRSMVFRVAFSFPPTNHRCSDASNRSTSSHPSIQSSASAFSAQKASGSAAADARSASYAMAASPASQAGGPMAASSPIRVSMAAR